MWFDLPATVGAFARRLHDAATDGDMMIALAHDTQRAEVNARRDATKALFDGGEIVHGASDRSRISRKIHRRGNELGKQPT